MLDLEDHAAVETSCDGQGKFTPLIDVGNGKIVPKPQIICELERAMFSKIPGSTDHLDCCAGLSQYTKITLPQPSSSVVIQFPMSS